MATDITQPLDLGKMYNDRAARALMHRAGDIGREYVDFAMNPQARIPLGWEWIDAVMRGGLAPGEVAVLLGGSSSGKTITLCNIAVNNAHMPVGFASIEMPIMLVAARLYAIGTGTEYRTLEEKLKAGADDLQIKIPRWLHHHLPNLGLMGVGSPDIEKLEKAVIEYNELFGQRMRLFMIDYLDLMGPASENVEYVKRKLISLRTLAKAQELSVLVLHQVKREVLDGRHGQPLRFTDGRYAGETEADHLLGQYRRINDPLVRDNQQLYELERWKVYLQCLKTRSDEAPGENVGHEMGWNPDTLKMTDGLDYNAMPMGSHLAMANLTQGMFEMGDA